jgi:predicted acetyltransferase
VTVVAVLPTHRRRGLLRRLMEAQLRDVREREEPVAALWASEETIYGRFGYGLASLGYLLTVDRRAVRIRPELPKTAVARFVDPDEALRVFPRVWDRLRARRVGFVSRSAAWWETRVLDDSPDRRRGAGVLNRVLLERGGRPVGYALYRIAQEGTSQRDWLKTVRVVEAIALDDAASADLWRILLEIDWIDRVTARNLPLDHPLLLQADRVNKLGVDLVDGLWTRVVDVPRTLGHLASGLDGRVTIEVTTDPLFPDNVGRWTIEDGRVRRASRRPDVVLDAEGLGAALLGGFPLARLTAAGRAVEGVRGGLARADALFRADAAPWCPEIF